MDRVVIGDYYYMKIMDENVNWMKLTYLLSIFLYKSYGPLFVHLPLL